MNTTIAQPNSPDLHHELIPLSDGRLGLRRGLQLELQTRSDDSGPGAGASPNTSPPILDFIASNQALDRYGEIIQADGWHLDNYRRNPVFQNAHQYGDILFTLGKALITEVREMAGGPALFQRIEFAVEVNPMARIAYGLYHGRFLNAVSVGFIPLRWEDGERERGASEREALERGEARDSALPQRVGRCVLSPPCAPAKELGGGVGHSALPGKSGGVGDSALPRRRFLEQELLEVSAVGIPANPEALQLGLKAGAIAKSDLQELLDLLGRFAGAQSAPGASPIFSDTAASNTLACAPGVRSDGAQLLQLARALREILRRT